MRFQFQNFAILLLLGGHCSAFAHQKQVTCTWVENAKITLDKKFNIKDYGHANYGHQIGTGNHSVLSFRLYEDWEEGPDSQVFSKTTLELDHIPKDIPVGHEMDIDTLRSYFTEGSEGFIYRGSYFWASNPLKRIRIRRTSDEFEAIVDVNIEATHARYGTTNAIHLNFRCPLQKRLVEKLSLWEGKLGTKYGSFTPNGR